MKKLVIGLLACSAMASSFAAADEGATPLVPPSEKVGGRTQADWSRLWWQWAGSFAFDESPVSDTKGSRCGFKQTGDVWFLAGTYGTRRTVRTCTVPAGRYLFFPMVNFVVYSEPTSGLTLSCEMARSTAARGTNEASALVLEVDGRIYRDLKAHRQATAGCFDLAEQSGGGLAPAAANGYYIMLRPLSRGTHTLNFGGSIPETTQAVTYTLQVE